MGSNGYYLGIKGQRERRLDRMKQQVADGSLVIRQASDAERERWRQEREQREAVAAASRCNLSHSSHRPAGARQQAADATGTDS
jgi:hypothetical protein